MAGSHYSPITKYNLPVLEDFFGDVPRKFAIDEARKDVMTVILEDFPGAGARTILRASDVAERLRLRGHTLAASLFAIRECVLARDFFVLPTPPPDEADWSPWNNVNIFVSSEWGSDLQIQGGPFGLTLDTDKRTIYRQGNSESVNLESGALPWFIFESVWQNRNRELDMDRFRAAYEAKDYSWPARWNALNLLNRRLKRIGVRIKNWCIKEVSEP